MIAPRFLASVLLVLFTIPLFGYTNSYSGNTAIASTSADASPSELGTTTTTVNNSDSWRQSAGEAVRNAEIATEKAYNQLARNVQNVSLEARIMGVLHENKTTRDSDVQVTADNGVVTITGQVASAQSAQHVQDVIANVYGVKAVNNQLKYPHDRGTVTPRDADSMGVAHPAYSDTAPAEKAPSH